LNAGWTKSLIEQAKTGMAASQVNISQTDLRGFWLPVCSKAEQSRIVTRVEELMHLCDALEAKGRLEATQHAQLVSTLLATLTESETPAQLTDNWHRIATHFDLLLDRPEAVDALEQTILQLAVRGLLVPQDPEDEPASVLLKNIRAEKDKLIAEGKIKRDKPLPPIAEDEQPFALPQGWEWVTMDGLASQITDGAHHTPTYIAEGVPFLSVKDLSSGFIDFSDTRFISPQSHEDLAKRCNPEMGDVLLTKIGTTGIAVVVDTPRAFSLFVSVALIKLPSVSVDRDFLSLVINSPFVRQQSEDGTEGVGNKNLVLRKIKAFQIPIPPLAEQSRIVTRVAQLRRLCVDLRQRLSASQSTQAHLAEALVQEVA
jgi:type I restriction enzyme S subunit